MHLQDTTHSFPVVLNRVIDGGACVDRTGVYAEIAQLSDERVGSNLECKRGKRLCVGGMSVLLLVRIRVNALDRLNVRRSGHEVNNRVKQRLNALVAVSGTAGDGNNLV